MPGTVWILTVQEDTFNRPTDIDRIVFSEESAAREQFEREVRRYYRDMQGCDPGDNDIEDLVSALYEKSCFIELEQVPVQ